MYLLSKFEKLAELAKIRISFLNFTIAFLNARNKIEQRGCNRAIKRFLDGKCDWNIKGRGVFKEKEAKTAVYFDVKMAACWFAKIFECCIFSALGRVNALQKAC